jgi:cytochrome c-type biogenesis protein CcmH
LQLEVHLVIKMGCSCLKDINQRFILGAFLTIAVCLMAMPVVAQENESKKIVTDDDVNAIAKGLYCPICESTPLDVCATQACADWREVIRTKLSEGQTQEEIEAYFELQYGARALAEPPRRGFTLAAWILPIAVVVVGGLVFGRYIRNMHGAKISTTNQKTLTSETETADDDYEARVERELREMR